MRRGRSRCRGLCWLVPRGRRRRLWDAMCRLQVLDYCAVVVVEGVGGRE